MINIGIFTVLALWTWLLPGSAVMAAGAPSFEPVAVSDRVWVSYGPLELPNEHNRGFRNNVVVVVTSAGVVVCDPGGSAWAGEQVAIAARSISPEPIVAVFNSHAHGDHWLGNEGIRRTYPDVRIHGHPVMKARVEGADGLQWLEQIERLTKGTATGRVVVAPDQAVNDGDEIVIGDTHFRIHHFGAAHSNNDIMVEIVGEGVVFTGDLVRNGMLGLMEPDSSFAGNIAAIDRLLEMDVQHFIPGHGRADGRAALKTYRSYLDTLLSKVRELYADGMVDYEMKSGVSRALSAFHQWKGFPLRLGPHVSRAYLQVEEEEF